MKPASPLQRYLLGGCLWLIICTMAPAAQGACESQFLSTPAMQQAFAQYFAKLKAQKWEGIVAFDRLQNQKIYMTPRFDKLQAEAKKRILGLLLLDYGEYVQLLPLLPEGDRRTLQGSMLPYTVYAADGRVLSAAYNPCNRLTTLTEYERSRLPFLGINIQRVQRFPMGAALQARTKKLFWSILGYEQAGDYWIEWVPEKGFFEIDVPSRNHNQYLETFWESMPTAYRYLVVDRGTPTYFYYRGKKSPIQNTFTDPELEPAS